jgi:hypothetical protein
MPHRYISVTIPKLTTQISLPNGTVTGAELLVEHDIPDQQSLNIKQNSVNSELANFSSSAIDRQVTIKVEQDVPFVATVQTGVSDWNGSAQYTKGNHVWWKGRVYRAKVDNGLNGAAYPNPAHWDNTTGDTGEIITLWPKAALASIPEGCWPLNGTTINAPWSPLHGVVTDNLNGKVVVGGSSVATSAYEAGKTSGSETFTLIQANLPNVSIPCSGNIAGTSAGTPSGLMSVSGYTGSSGSHAHSLNGNAGWDGTSGVGGSDRSSNYAFGSTSSAGDHQHYVSLSGSLSGSAMPSHSHTFSGTATLNSSAAQGVPVRQPAIHCLMFVRL